jgi:hypothetical protein
MTSHSIINDVEPASVVMPAESTRALYDKVRSPPLSDLVRFNALMEAADIVREFCGDVPARVIEEMAEEGR